MSEPNGSPEPATDSTPVDQHHPHGREAALWKLAVGAIGIVFGDIGTSPLYAFKETFAGHHPLALDQEHIMGVISLMFWSMMVVVTLKYVSVIMRADNKGEGGSLALLALINRSSGKKRKWTAGIVILGVFATALFYGDSMITPAVSVLSAVEGIAVAAPTFTNWILPVAVAILVGLFSIQRTGTARVGAMFGPIMLGYFATIATLGTISVVQTPEVLWALLPTYAIHFFLIDGLAAFLALGSVVLAVTGAEALYADMGHFGRRPIRISWLWFVLPALMLNYMGQGALLMRDDGAIASPFYLLAPEWLRLPLVGIATMAAIIASQAVITGAFSVTQQGIQLGFIPRLRITHTSAATAGQIYIPLVNWALMIAIILLVLTFRTSSNLTAAYGIAVTGAMLIDNCLIAVVLFTLWKWKKRYAIPLLALFFVVDLAYFAANLTKVPYGGWFPLMVGVIIFTMLTTWAKGRGLMVARMRESAMPIQVFIQSAANSATRVPGTAVFMTSTPEGVPHALLHNLKHNKVLHERVVLLTVKIADQPFVSEAERVTLDDLGEGFHRMKVYYGFMQEADVPAALAMCGACGGKFNMMDTSFFLSRQTLLPSDHPGMHIWREKLFAWMLRNAEGAMEFFRLPTNRVVELGSQVEI
ncbi:potassium transporter Kup [Sphingomonas sp. ST-64]|uniref:Probable potassium transport system protein Kup n=1 Tax=Sphingomonas plantiphila TaxID=3163295 RepID=A0ABW8YQN5_9SPHN